MAMIAAVLFAALVASAAAAPKEDLHQQQFSRNVRGVRGGEEDDTVVVEAAENGVEPEPRELACPPQERYMSCGSACPHTCLSIRAPRACPNVCSTGCFCKEGMVRDYSGQCIKPSEC